MNMRERGQEERRQAEAEAAERKGMPPGADASVNEYRLVLRALRTPPTDGLPADFAARVARRVLFAEERGSFEEWSVVALMLAMAGAALFYLQPVLAKFVAAFNVHLPAVPVPLLLAAGVAVGLAWAVEQGAGRLNK